MKKIIIFCLITSFINAQEINLTLEQSLELGLKYSKELKIAESIINKASAVRDEISSSMLPKISFNARYARLSDVDPFIVDVPILPQPITIQESILDNYVLSASVEQPLFTGFRLSSLKSAADYNSKSAIINLETERNDKAVKIIESFWKLYTSEQLKILMHENLSALKEHLKNTEALLNNGLVTKNDLLKLKVEVANLELKLLEATNNNDIARAFFNKTLGLSIDSKTKIVTDTSLIISNPKDLDELLNEANANRYEIKSTKLQISALKDKETAAMSDWYPQLFAFGNFYYNNPNQRYMPLERKFNQSWDVGVAMKWDLWNWGGTSAKLEQAKQDVKKAQNQFDLLEENIELDVYNKYLNLEKSLKKIKLGLLQVESAEENFRITEKKYYQQLTTTTDLIDAETALLNARTNLLTSKIEYNLSKTELDRSLGRKLYME